MKTLATLFTGLFLVSASAVAQRDIDLQLTLITPADGEYIPPMQNFPITVSVKNVGTTNLEAADSVAWYLLMNGDTITFQPQNENHVFFTGNFLAPGDSVSFTRYMGFDASFQDMIIDLCVFVRPFSEADPATDPQLGNNTDCATINVMNDPAGLEEWSAIRIRVSPNPATDQFTVLAEKPVKSVGLIDASGKAVAVNVSGTTVDCRGVEPGTYFVVVETTEGKALQRIVIR